LPNGVQDRPGWATDIYAALAALDVAPTADNICAIVAVIGQESGFQADPVVPGLPGIARKEIARRAEEAGIPSLAVDAALEVQSTDGRSYAERLKTIKTERQLSELYEDFISQVPFGKTLLASRNPVRTGGAMQVSVAFAESAAHTRNYPYPINKSLRAEVFSRRGSIYFGTAHLLDYPAPYTRQLYRFADYNAGRYASRNAAFQAAVSDISGIPLDPDGDLLIGSSSDLSATERAIRVVGRRLGLSDADIRRDLEQQRTAEFERTQLYKAVFSLADRQAGKAVSRAQLPHIVLKSPKITRTLTTEWFANRTQTRYESCLRQVG
jgi:hypothetical protein